eukprot:CAMPEP_0202732166 /NCGR_PEP_ID=MMETSP1385-20130828/187518_1 /ASSEMBLY_ACC=CAM_ASM_000861 /TAXON_ID=933848 /ORGANISM="Elphidium margaritaceum" /LENGTH=222 /DNA_ID=CAMNT_0049398473 /DNA_START=435 /DNA_END=1099 /DNA_ORIENTATION=+
MNAVDTLPITQLIWNADVRQIDAHMTTNQVDSLVHFIQTNLWTKFPALEGITFGRSVYSLSMKIYLCLDAAFLQKAMRCKIDLRFIRHFKYIDLKCLYYGRSRYSWEQSITKRTALFEYILKRIIEQSQRSLQTLEINILKCFGGNLDLDTYSGLSLIMNAVDTLPITRLIWNGDLNYQLGTNRDYLQLTNFIQTNLRTKFPNLEDVTFGCNVSALSMKIYP